ncbi:MAG: hypothetical protein BWY82_01283 [Verrucomicrobia bacterium ADurb.Bin474]|nr:MAG: hypothetical protein BWY82_01283 [Verrucomicrobia bacterium ADurb.Bin474]
MTHPGKCGCGAGGGDRPGVHEVVEMPIIRAETSFSCQIRPDPAGTPLERIVIDGLAEAGVVPVSHHIGLEHADHLGMAVVASLRDVDVASGKFERGEHALDATLQICCTVDHHSRDDLDRSTDCHRREGQDGEPK